MGSVYDNPEGIRSKTIGQFVNGDVTLCEGCVFDYMTIQWDNVNLNQYDLDLWLPSNLLSVLDIKIILRRLFDNPNTLFRIIVYIPQSNKIKPLILLYKLMPNDDIEEVVSIDTIS